MVEVLLVVGILFAIFVGFNIGGSSTGVAFGPAVGAGTVTKVTAAALMTVFAIAGGLIFGTRVVETLGNNLIDFQFTLVESIVILFFIGGALLLSNVGGVPASTSMTTVGAIAGAGIARGGLKFGPMQEIVSWWLVSPIIAFWVSGVIGRYFYPGLVEWFAITQSEGELLTVDRSRWYPRPVLGENTTTREFVGTALVVGIGCYMAFSAGASNVANAVAPLVGNGSIDMIPGVLLGGAAIGLGAFTIARRTMDTVGNDLTDLPLVAALLVAVVSSTIVTILSAMAIPASFVIIATMSIVGLGWGRATRTRRLQETFQDVPVEPLTEDAPDAPTVGDANDAGDEKPSRERRRDTRDESIPSATDLFEPKTTARVILLQNVVPVIATIASFLVFQFVTLS